MKCWRNTGKYNKDVNNFSVDESAYSLKLTPNGILSSKKKVY